MTDPELADLQQSYSRKNICALRLIEKWMQKNPKNSKNDLYQLLLDADQCDAARSLVSSSYIEYHHVFLQFVYPIFTNQIAFKFMQLLIVTTDSSCDLYVLGHCSCLSAAKLTEITINLAVFIKDVRPQLVCYIPIHTQIIDSYNNPCRQVTDFCNYNIDFFCYE